MEKYSLDFLLTTIIANYTVYIPRMWLTSGRASGHKKMLLQYYSLTPLERERYEGDVQPSLKTYYKPIIYIIFLAILKVES